VSKVEDSGTTPSAGQRPSVTFRPTVPVMQAGIRTEPAVSLPKASSAEPSKRLTPAPRPWATRRPRDICIDLPHELAEVIGVRGAHVIMPPRNHDAIAEIRRSLFGRQNGPAH
jgi:hypothetical protein